MTQYTLDLQLQTVPPVMKRHRHVLVVLQTNQGKYVLGSKKIYPTGIYRLIGGGVEEHEEDMAVAAAREIEEELGIVVPPQDLQALAQITAHIASPTLPQPITFTTYLFGYRLTDQKLAASSDLDGIQVLSETEMKKLILTYQQLPPVSDPELGFSWADYGKLYGPIHQISLSLTHD